MRDAMDMEDKAPHSKEREQEEKDSRQPKCPEMIVLPTNARKFKVQVVEQSAVELGKAMAPPSVSRKSGLDAYLRPTASPAGVPSAKAVVLRRITGAALNG
uniref:Uncharacterized protein n=1 Tax=Peronospora matthiolae TaxID=2874970 RepID=A0AAV1UGM3_9STRA